jgi:predicted DNA-binding protein (UPF0251 family)
MQVSRQAFQNIIDSARNDVKDIIVRIMIEMLGHNTENIIFL